MVRKQNPRAPFRLWLQIVLRLKLLVGAGSINMLRTAYTVVFRCCVCAVCWSAVFVFPRAPFSFLFFSCHSPPVVVVVASLFR